MNLQHFLARLDSENTTKKGTHRLGKPCAETALAKWQTKHPEAPLPELLQQFYKLCDGVILARYPDAIAEAGGQLRLLPISKLEWAGKVFCEQLGLENEADQSQIPSSWIRFGVNDNNDYWPVFNAVTGEIRVVSLDSGLTDARCFESLEPFLDWVATEILDPLQAERAEAVAAKEAQKKTKKIKVAKLKEEHQFLECRRVCNGLVISPDGNWLVTIASGSDHQAPNDLAQWRSLRLWNLPERKMVRAYEKHLTDNTVDQNGNPSAYRDRDFQAVALSPDSQLVAAISNHQLFLYERDSGELRLNLPLAGFGRTLVFTSDGQSLVVTASQSMGADDIVQVFNVTSGQLCKQCSLPQQGMTTAVLTPNEKQLITATAQLKINIWQFPSGTLVHTFDKIKHTPKALAFSPDGQRIVCGFDDGREVWILDTQTWEVVAKIAGVGLRVKAVCYSPNGQMIATGNEMSAVQIWDAHSGAPLYAFRGRDVTWGNLESGDICSLSFCPDNKHLLYGGSNHTLRLMRIPD